MQPAGRTVVVVDPAYAAHVPRSSDAEIHPCDDPELCVTTLDPDVRGVVLGPIPRLTIAQRRQFVIAIDQTDALVNSIHGLCFGCHVNGGRVKQQPP